MHDRSLIRATTDEVRRNGNQSTVRVSRESSIHKASPHSHHTEYAGGSQTLAVGTGNAATGSSAPNLEEIRAIIHSADEGWNRLRSRSVTVTKERHNGGLGARAVPKVLARTWRAVGVIQHQLAAAEERLRRLLPNSNPPVSLCPPSTRRSWVLTRLNISCSPSCSRH